MFVTSLVAFLSFSTVPHIVPSVADVNFGRAGIVLPADRGDSPAEIAFNRLSLEERKVVQRFAQSAGGYKGPLDGKWGPGTAAAMPGLIEYYNADSGTSATLDDADGLEFVFRALQNF